MRNFATGGGGPLENYRNPARQHVAIFHAATCQGARWRTTQISGRGACATGADRRARRGGRGPCRRPAAQGGAGRPKPPPPPAASRNGKLVLWDPPDAAALDL